MIKIRLKQSNVLLFNYLKRKKISVPFLEKF
jgi:hypothetical protein